MALRASFTVLKRTNLGQKQREYDILIFRSFMQIHVTNARRYAASIHQVFSQYALSIQSVRTQYSDSMHQVFGQYTSSIQSVSSQGSVFTQYSNGMQQVYMYTSNMWREIHGQTKSGCSTFLVLGDGGGPNERIITVGIGWVLLVSATSRFSGYIKLAYCSSAKGLQ